MPVNPFEPRGPHNPFEDFINGLDLPDEEPDRPTHQELPGVVPYSDLTESVRAAVLKALNEIIDPDMSTWVNRLDEIRTIIRAEILKHVVPNTGQLDRLTPEELAVQTAATYMTLGWLVYDRVVDELFGNPDDGDLFDPDDDEDSGKSAG